MLGSPGCLGVIATIGAGAKVGVGARVGADVEVGVGDLVGSGTGVEGMSGTSLRTKALNPANRKTRPGCPASELLSVLNAGWMRWGFMNPEEL